MHSLSRSCTLIVPITLAIAFSALTPPSRGQQSADSSSALARCEDILRQAGASSAQLAKFEREMQLVSPDDIASIEDDLRKQPCGSPKL